MVSPVRGMTKTWRAAPSQSETLAFRKCTESTLNGKGMQTLSVKGGWRKADTKGVARSGGRAEEAGRRRCHALAVPLPNGQVRSPRPRLRAHIFSHSAPRFYAFLFIFVALCDVLGDMFFHGSVAGACSHPLCARLTLNKSKTSNEQAFCVMGSA